MASTQGPLRLVAKGIAGLGLGVGVLLYLHGIFRERLSFGMKNIPVAGEARFLLALEGLSGSTGSTGRMTGFWREADAIYAARLKAIRNARTNIHFETFFMTGGQRADEFADALLERAAAGVEVLMVVDAYGVGKVEDAYWDRLRQGGVQVQRFRPFSWAAPLDYLARTHRKLLLIDGKTAYVGGAGVSDWWDGNPDLGDRAPWRDLEIRLEGPVVNVLEGMFLQNWACTGNDLDLNETLFPDVAVSIDQAPSETAVQLEAGGGGGGGMAPTEAPLPSQPENHHYVITSGTFSLENSAPRMMYLLSILAARQRVWIASPYFLPDENTIERLKWVREKGVEVKVLTMGPATDRPYVHVAAQVLYEELLKVGVEVYEYEPAMMHAKLILVDDCWASTGSANFDHMSFFNNDELNVSSADPALVREIEAFFEDSLPRCKRITEETLQDGGRLKRLEGEFWLAFKRVF